ncbi:D-alanyl-D-alanine carboxypeptidase family protein [Pseudorhizobium pelagicum]|uniref:D-alanyl-D-alanine carboxypeptidase family protein n=1 Tax=Pseudorhizobium pelagicum TaxID=1509405 RepID=UPI0009DE6E22|nr:D-alanyl-D-alanine carboxypeptidase family protein [Pseudorhizobium pelagicum]
MVKTSRARAPWKHLLIIGFCFAVHPANATPVLVVDAGTREVLYQEEAGRPWYPASTTKLMTALVVFEALHATERTLSTPVTMSRNAVNQPFVNSDLTVDRSMTLEDALFAMLTASANDVAVAVAESVAPDEASFIGRMNETAKRIGLTGTHFASPNGLFDPQNYTTARDLAILGMYLDQKFPEYRHFFQASAVTIDGKELMSNNELLTRFPGTIGMKTGFLCASGRTFVGLAAQNGRRIMVVLLGATTERERNERSAKFLTEAFSGQLASETGIVDTLANQTDTKPEDMRVRLCTSQAESYQASRDAAFPMGLAGHQSYLHAPVQGVTHVINTWINWNAADVPIPLPRPS